MEPLSALSLAACTAQLLDFGCKVLRQSQEIRDKGSSISTLHIANLTKDLISVNDDLQSKCIKPTEASAEEQALLSTSRACTELASDLQDILQTIVRTAANEDRWSSIASAVKTVWRRDKIEDMNRRLNEYRSQLTLRVLSFLSAHRTVQEEQIRVLGSKADEIIETVSLNFDSLRADLQLDDFAAYSNGGTQHINSLAAILKTRTGQSLTLTQPGGSQELTKLLSQKGVAQTTSTYKYLDDSTASHEQLFTALPPSNIAQRIIDALHYRQITDRQETVNSAHKKTFEWILSRSGDFYRDPSNDFLHWLKSGNGCYWISGKAGSGKSTLMKFLRHDSRTRSSLEDWAGSCSLLVSTFYFWYAGTPLQRSHTGMLRTLLFELLSQRPHMVMTVFPDLYRSILNRSVNLRIDFPFPELSRAFRLFMSCMPGDTKLCLFIDGIDEYDGNHNEICEVLMNASRQTTTKIIVSSRPVPSCVDTFASCPRLALHQLTRDDIWQYVADKLDLSTSLRRMESFLPGAKGHITKNITSKAEGVFLWVVLVVKIVLEGLQNYDTLEQLLKRVDELPADLEKLYDHMLGSMSVRHQEEGSKMLRLVLRSQQTHGDFPMTLLQLSFAEEASRGVEHSDEVWEMTVDQEKWRAEATEGRMRSRCSGLIEVLEPSLTDGLRSEMEVGFLHRTVVEFLQHDMNWEKLNQAGSDSKYNLDDVLIDSTLTEMKVKSSIPAQDRNSFLHPALRCVLRVFAYLDSMKHQRDLDHQSHFANMMKIVAVCWSNKVPTTRATTKFRAALAEIRREQIWKAKLQFLAYAAFQLPSDQFSWCIRFLMPSTQAPTNKPHGTMADILGAYLLMNYLAETRTSLRISIVKALRYCPLEPNHCPDLPKEFDLLWTSGWTFWRYLLHHASLISQLSRHNAGGYLDEGALESYCMLVCSFIDQGADVCIALKTTTTSATDKFGNTTFTVNRASAYYVLRQFMSKVWSLRCDVKSGSQQQIQARSELAKCLTHLENKLTQHSSKAWTSTEIREVSFSDKIFFRRRQARKKAISKGQPTDRQEGSETASGKITYDHVEVSLSKQESPWRYVDNLTSSSAINQGGPNGQAKTESHVEVDAALWQRTPKLRRIELLNSEEQDLVCELALTHLDAKAQRRIFNSISKLSMNTQSRIFECSSILREAESRS